MSVIRDWRQYRAFAGLAESDRHIVVYSESGQDWHHFAPVIEQLTKRYDRSVCYLTSDEYDPGLGYSHRCFKSFCIGAGIVRTILFQFLKADLCLLTMLDLGVLQLKRSINAVHYTYMFHTLASTHMVDLADSYDHYDSILCAGPHHVREIRRREELAGLPAKQLFEHGYHRLEELLAGRRPPPEWTEHADIRVLLAPSWGDDTILNVCGESLVGVLLDAGFGVTVRPHYQTRLKTPAVLDGIVDRHGDRRGFELVERMGDSESLFDAHIMITDWSGAGVEFALGLEKPVLYIDVPPKTRNDDWQSYGIEPFEKQIRSRIGAVVSPSDLDAVPQTILGLLKDPQAFSENVAELRSSCVFNLGHSVDAAAEAIAGAAAESARIRAAEDSKRP